MPTFPLLADPAHYVPCSTEDMHVDIEYRDHWVHHFMNHFKTVMRLAVETYGPESQSRADACYKDVIHTLQELLFKPQTYKRLDLLVLDALRQDILVAHGLPDPFEKAKQKENEICLPLYPKIVAELDSHGAGREGLLLAAEGIVTGNIFDLGARATLEMFATQSPDFLAVRAKVNRDRPWLIDHFEALADRLLDGKTKPHRQAMFFLDNAGSDAILGVIPFCRMLALRGTRVLIAANHLPALNDLTYSELVTLLPRLQSLDPTLDRLVKDGLIVPIDSGSGIPLIDLREVSEAVVNHSKETDLLILEGMGRAVETNLQARFTVDTLKIALIKDEMVAKRRGGKMFDTICRFDPA